MNPLTVEEVRRAVRGRWRTPQDPQTVEAVSTDTRTATKGDLFVALRGARFDGHASSDEDGEVVAWEWDFGDGTQAEGAEVEHTWEEPGTYSVTLWVTDDAGALFGASQVVEVLAPPLPLIEGRKMQESCACRVAGTPPGQVWWLLGALLLLGRRRIRGR